MASSIGAKGDLRLRPLARWSIGVRSCVRLRVCAAPSTQRAAHRDVLAEHIGFEVHGVARRALRASAVCCNVNGTICTPTRASGSVATVRLMPSIAIEPF